MFGVWNWLARRGRLLFKDGRLQSGPRPRRPAGPFSGALRSHGPADQEAQSKKKKKREREREEEGKEELKWTLVVPDEPTQNHIPPPTTSTSTSGPKPPTRPVTRPRLRAQTQAEPHPITIPLRTHLPSNLISASAPRQHCTNRRHCTLPSSRPWPAAITPPPASSNQRSFDPTQDLSSRLVLLPWSLALGSTTRLNHSSQPLEPPEAHLHRPASYCFPHLCFSWPSAPEEDDDDSNNSNYYYDYKSGTPPLSLAADTHPLLRPAALLTAFITPSGRHLARHLPA